MRGTRCSTSTCAARRALPDATDLTLAELMDDSLGAEALIARLGPREAA